MSSTPSPLPRLAGCAPRARRAPRGLVPEGRARAIALLHAYEAAIDAATRIADLASAALDREVCDAEIEEVREKLVRTLVEIGHLV